MEQKEGKKKKKVLLEQPYSAKFWDWKQFRCLKSNRDPNLILQQFNPFEFSTVPYLIQWCKEEKKSSHVSFHRQVSFCSVMEMRR